MSTPDWKRFLAPALVCLVLGMVVAIQMKTQEKVQLTLREKRVSEDMVAQFLKVSEERDRLRAELYRLQELASVAATAATLQEELDLELASAGLLEVRGPGVSVSLTDLSGVTTRQVTAEDIMLVLNELRAGGAEAIAINSERVTDRLRVFRDSRNTTAPLKINGQITTGPIVISAVGDPQILTSSLQMRGGVVSFLAPWLQVTVTARDDLLIPAAKAPLYSYGRPVR